MRPIAVIDVGSNSVFLLLVEPRPDGGLRVLERHKDAARLRDEVGEDGRLSMAGRYRLLSTMARFQQVIERTDAEVKAAATASLRAAIDRDEVVDEIRRVTGIDLVVIDGDTEANLAWLGVLYGLGAVSTDTICADIGGGSTELVLALGSEVQATVSVPVGALVVHKSWIGEDPVTLDAIEAARCGLREALTPYLGPFWGRGPFGIASSGTIQRVARICRALEGRDSQGIHGMMIDRVSLQRVIDMLVAAPTRDERLAIPGMDASRADILLGGALIHEAVADLLGLQQWTVSMAGIRLGMVAQVLESRGLWRPGDPPHPETAAARP